MMRKLVVSSVLFARQAPQQSRRNSLCIPRYDVYVLSSQLNIEIIQNANQNDISADCSINIRAY